MCWWKTGWEIVVPSKSINSCSASMTILGVWIGSSAVMALKIAFMTITVRSDPPMHSDLWIHHYFLILLHFRAAYKSHQLISQACQGLQQALRQQEDSAVSALVKQNSDLRKNSLGGWSIRDRKEAIGESINQPYCWSSLGWREERGRFVGELELGQLVEHDPKWFVQVFLN